MHVLASSSRIVVARKERTENVVFGPVVLLDNRNITSLPDEMISKWVRDLLGFEANRYMSVRSDVPVPGWPTANILTIAAF